MNGAIERFDVRARRVLNAGGRTVAHDDELVRLPVYTRVLHWAVAVFFILSLLSGFAVYSGWLYRAVTPLFGGGPMTRLLHPWFSLAFVIVFVLQFLNWLEPMKWNPDDRRWMRRMKTYVTNAEEVEPEYVGFFNAGQKMWFWAIAACGAAFLVSGIAMWFPDVFGRVLVAIAYVVHDVAALSRLARASLSGAPLPRVCRLRIEFNEIRHAGALVLLDFDFRPFRTS